jgi:hypothetical protein
MPENCSDARHAVSYYRALTWDRQAQRGGELATRTPIARGKACRWVRYAAKEWAARAQAARETLERWAKDEWNWQAWLPDKFARVGACETGYGKRPGDWTWDSGTYVSAFGIYRPAYEAYHRWTGHNTPREQYEVASAIQARFGWGAWGCGGA